MMNTLIVEDNLNLRDIYEEALTFEGHDVVCCASPEEAYDLMGRARYNVVISDLYLDDGPEMTQDWVDTLIDQSRDGVIVVVVSGRMEYQQVCEDAGLIFLLKPISAIDLADIISQQVRS